VRKLASLLFVALLSSSGTAAAQELVVPDAQAVDADAAEADAEAESAEAEEEESEGERDESEAVATDPRAAEAAEGATDGSVPEDKQKYELKGGTAPAAEEKTEKSDAPVPPAGKERVIVLDLALTAVDVDVASLVSELLTVELSKTSGIEVISGADVRRMIELEATRQQVGCTEDASCLAEIAGAMGARYVIYGRLGKLGERLLLTLNLFDSDEASAISRVDLKPESMDVLPDELPGAVARLMAPLTGDDVPAAASASASASAKVSAGAPSGGGGGGFLPWALIGGGGAVLALGAAYDVFAPASDDGVLDGFDAIGPLIMVTGGATALGGVAWMLLSGGDDA
jgi:TolB-like protein